LIFVLIPIYHKKRVNTTNNILKTDNDPTY